jgi:small subunit ribosomal protein S6
MAENMTRYETLMLLKSSASAQDKDFLEKSLKQLATEAKGSFASFDVWGKYRLAYPVQKESYGVYVLARYEVPNEILQKFMQDLKMFFRVRAGEFVMRNVSVRLEDDAPAEYAKPDPADSNRAAGADSSNRESRGRSSRFAGKVRYDSSRKDDSSDSDVVSSSVESSDEADA